MSILRPLLLSGAVSALLATVPVYPASSAIAAPAAVTVRSVGIERVRERGDWLELAVELAVARRPAPDAYVDRIAVNVLLAYEVDRPGGRRWHFYEGFSEAVTLPPGSAVLRFYLPPDVVARDRLRPEAVWYAVNLHVQGSPQPATPAAFHRELRTAEARRNFLERGKAEAVGNAGILVPQHASPFAFDPAKPSPAVIRGEERSSR